jgi:hypothetical protein
VSLHTNRCTSSCSILLYDVGLGCSYLRIAHVSRTVFFFACIQVADIGIQVHRRTTVHYARKGFYRAPSKRMRAMCFLLFQSTTDHWAIISSAFTDCNFLPACFLSTILVPTHLIINSINSTSFYTSGPDIEYLRWYRTRIPHERLTCVKHSFTIEMRHRAHSVARL